MHLLAVEFVVDAAVGVLITEAVADREGQVGLNRYVAEVVEPVQVSAQRDAVGDLVRAANSPRPDVRRFQNG